MNIQIIIPAHNEEQYLSNTLTSLLQQTMPATKIVVVNDNSTDKTKQILDGFVQNHTSVSAIELTSNGGHQPGSKVINAFLAGLETLENDYDIICKFDADLIFPPNYLKTIAEAFQKDSKTGMAGGFCYIEKDGEWQLENLTNKDHIRGALKAYRKECFEQIGGLQPSMGWDTVDELLAQYHGWNVATDQSLHVKHLKPTGAIYTKASKYKQGEAFYKMRYGWALTQVAAMKLAQRKASLSFYYNCMRGYLKAKQNRAPFLVSKEEGTFIRELRWKNIRKKIF